MRFKADEMDVKTHMTVAVVVAEAGGRRCVYVCVFGARRGHDGKDRDQINYFEPFP